MIVRRCACVGVGVVGGCREVWGREGVETGQRWTNISLLTWRIIIQ